MAKPIRFPLEMAKGVKVNTIEELREYFDLEKTLGYYIDGKLLAWLKGRYYENEATQIDILNNKDADFKHRLCDILGVQCKVDEAINITELEVTQKRISQIRQYTDDDDIIRNIDKVAFNQEELNALLSGQVNKVYLCGEKFSVSLTKENISYIGINRPTVILAFHSDIDFDKKNITFNNVHFTSENKIRIVARKSHHITMDTDKINTNLNFKNIISSFDISKQDTWYDAQMYLYKNLLIITNRWDFAIYNIHTKEKLVSFEDVKKDNWSLYSKACITVSTIYKEYIVMFFEKCESGGSSKLMLFNLEKLKVQTVVTTPSGHDGNSNVYVPDYISIHNDCIGLYQKLSDGSISRRIKYQLHKFSDCSYVKAGSFDIEDSGYNRERTFGNIYLGQIYRFSLLNKKIISTKADYNCKGFYKDGKDQMCTIGNFIIYSDKIIAARCEERNSLEQHYYSAVDIGQFAVYDINGGYPLKTVKVSDKRITNFIHSDNSLVVLGKDSNKIFFYNDSTFDLNHELTLDLSLSTWSQTNCWVCNAYIDAETRRMAVSYNGVIVIYE